MADETVPRSSDRIRTYTEKGLEWQLEQRVLSIRTLINKWNASAERLSIFLSDFSTQGKFDTEVSLLDQRDQMVSYMHKLRDEDQQYRNLLGTNESYQNLESLKIIQSFDKIANEHHDLIMAVTKALCDVKDKKSETGSATSHTSHRSSKSKHSSTSKASSTRRSQRSRASSTIAEEAASLKIKLKYLEAESKAKLELDRIKLQKGLDLAQVSLDQFEEETALSCFEVQSTHSDYTAKYVLAHSNASQTDDQDRKENVRIAAQNPEPHTNRNPVMSFYSPTICKSNGVSIQDSISYASIKTEPIYTMTVSMNPAAAEFFPNTSGFGNIGFGHEQHPTLPYFKDNMLPSSAVQNTALSSFAYSHPHAQVKQVLGDLHIPTNGVSSTTQVSTTSFSCHNHPLASIQQTVHEPLQISNQVNKESSQNTNATSEQALLSLVKSLTDQVNLGRLPAPETSIFTGDPLKYPGWRVDFTTLIEQRKIPSAERIHYLKKYLGGTAKEAVENFFLISSDNAYDEAKKL